MGLKNHSHERLRGSLTTFESELAYLKARPVPSGCSAGWVAPAEKLLEQARALEKRGDENAGFRCLLAAQRLALFGLCESERVAKATSLRNEAEKIETAWRKKTILNLLSAGASQTTSATGEMQCDPGAAALYEATLVRDEHSHNQYFKLSLLQSQLKLLSVFLLLSFLGFLTILLRPDLIPSLQVAVGATPASASDPQTLNARTTLLVVLFGVVGATFSAIVSTATVPSVGRIPEHLSAVALTISRAVIGAPAALLLVFFLRSAIIKIGDLPVSDLFVTLVIAFAAGSSERLVLRAVESISAKSST
jgi:hypothetical protein